MKSRDSMVRRVVCALQMSDCALTGATPTPCIHALCRQKAADFQVLPFREESSYVLPAQIRSVLRHLSFHSIQCHTFGVSPNPDAACIIVRSEAGLYIQEAKLPT